MDGCIEVSSVATNEIAVNNEVAVADPDAAFKAIGKGFQPKLAHCTDEKKEIGDADGNYLTVSFTMGGKKRNRLVDSDDDDYNPMDVLCLSIVARLLAGVVAAVAPGAAEGAAEGAPAPVAAAETEETKGPRRAALRGRSGRTRRWPLKEHWWTAKAHCGGLKTMI